MNSYTFKCFCKFKYIILFIYPKKTIMETDSLNADLSSGIAAFESKNFAMAYQLLLPIATQGDDEALFRVGMMQMNGLGMVEDQNTGFENLKKSAEKGHGFAKHMVGVAYMQGEGVEKDIKQAINYFEQAADLGLAGAMMTLGMIYEEGKDVQQDTQKAQYYYNLAEKNT